MKCMNSGLIIGRRQPTISRWELELVEIMGGDPLGDEYCKAGEFVKRFTSSEKYNMDTTCIYNTECAVCNLV